MSAPGGQGHREEDARDVVWELEAEVARLREALRKYGRHRGVCRVRWERGGPGWACICGFDSALEASSEPRP